MNGSNRRSLGESTGGAPAVERRNIGNSQNYVGMSELFDNRQPMHDSLDDPRRPAGVLRSIVPRRPGPKRGGRPARAVQA